MPPRDDEFYVGYLPESPPGLASRTRLAVAVVLAFGLAVALVLVSGQARFDPGTFEFGVDRTFEGVVVERPYPVLLVPGEGGGFRSHYLVAFGKRGAADLVAGRDGEAVRVTGSRIYNDRERMIEVHELEPLSGGGAEALRRLSLERPRSLGTLTLAGEIVDSKCHFGVMKPGRGKPHKACAIQCIRGGIPPVLRVEDVEGRVDYFLLVSREGLPVNREVLDLVAEPVEITGEVVREGDRLVLRADPSGYRRLAS